jgi:hypothetical protein
MRRILGIGVHAAIVVVLLAHHRHHHSHGPLGTEPSGIWDARVCVYDGIVDAESFLRRLVHQPRTPGCRHVQVEPRTLAAVIHRSNLAAPMVTWLRQEASRTDLDHTTRLRVVQTLAYLRMESSGIPLSRTGPWEQRKRLYQRYRDVRAELAELPLPPAIADWAARDFGTE